MSPHQSAESRNGIGGRAEQCKPRDPKVGYVTLDISPIRPNADEASHQIPWSGHLWRSRAAVRRWRLPLQAIQQRLHFGGAVSAVAA